MIPSFQLKHEMDELEQFSVPHTGSSSYYPSSHQKLNRGRKADIEQEVDGLITEIENGKKSTLVLSKKEFSDQRLVRIIEAACKLRSKVTEIDASNNNITSITIRGLLLALFRNTQIKVLNLAHNKINSEGITYFLNISKDNFTITCINFFKNLIENCYLTSLMLLLKGNTKYQKELTKSQQYALVLSILDRFVIRLVDNKSNNFKARRKVELELYPAKTAAQEQVLELSIAVNDSKDIVGMSFANNITGSSVASEDEISLPIERLKGLNNHFKRVEIRSR